MSKVDITTRKGQDNAPPSEHPYFHKVNVGLSVGLYKPGTGTRSWVARFRHDGKYRTKTLEDVKDYADAVAAATDYANQVKQGEAPTRLERAAKAKGNLTVQQLITEYIDQDAMQVSKGDRYAEWKYTSTRLSKRYVFDYIGRKPIRALTADDLKDLQTKLRKEVSAETVNRGLVTLRAALNYALAKGYIRAAFWKGVPLLEEAEPEEKTNSKEYFDLATRQTFIEAAGAHLAPLVTCMHLTGCRPSEARRLTVGDVHVDGRLKTPFVRFKTFKGNRVSGTGRKFPLANGRLDFFREQVKDREKDETLFTTMTGLPWAMGNLNKRHNEVRDALGMDKSFQTYCWRHAWITDMIRANVQPLTVAKLAGTSLKYIQDNYTAGDDTLAEQIPEFQL